MLILLVLVVIIILVIVYADQVAAYIEDFLTWIEENPVLGPAILALLYIVATVAFIPGSILTLGAGWAFQ